MFAHHKTTKMAQSTRPAQQSSPQVSLMGVGCWLPPDTFSEKRKFNEKMKRPEGYQSEYYKASVPSPDRGNVYGPMSAVPSHQGSREHSNQRLLQDVSGNERLRRCPSLRQALKRHKVIRCGVAY